MAVGSEETVTPPRPPVLLLALVVGTSAACAAPAWIDQRPRFSSEPQVWDLPLYEPLTRVGPHLVATALGRPSGAGPAPSEEVLFYVDSGSSHAALLAQTFSHLGLPTSSSRFVTVEDAAGATHGWTGAVLPQLRLGPIADGRALSDVVASVTDYKAVLGADVLAAHGWRIDLDDGILRLGAEPWPPTADVVEVPIQRFRDHAIADLRIAGEEVPLLVDTGAPFTIVDIGLLRRLGLREVPLASRWPLGGAGHTLGVTTSFEGKVALGGRDLGVRRIFGHPAALSVGRGMMGNDILYGYAFQVTRAGLQLKPRATDLLSSAPRRIARWRDLPSCPTAPGCITADLVTSRAADGLPQVGVRFQTVPPRPFRYLFGCADPAGLLRASPLWIEIAVRQPVRGVEIVIPVAPEVPAAFRHLWANGCERLVLLDANPIVDGARPLPPTAEAHLATDIRRLSFR
jgi:predicted aspartyl protease